MTVVAFGVGTDGEHTPFYKNLLTALEFYPGRWMESAVAAAAEAPNLERLSPEEWAEMLDDLDAALQPIFPGSGPIDRILRRAQEPASGVRLAQAKRLLD